MYHVWSLSACNTAPWCTWWIRQVEEHYETCNTFNGVISTRSWVRARRDTSCLLQESATARLLKLDRNKKFTAPSLLVPVVSRHRTRNINHPFVAAVQGVRGRNPRTHNRTTGSSFIWRANRRAINWPTDPKWIYAHREFECTFSRPPNMETVVLIRCW